MKPKELITKWVKAFNDADVDALAELYAEDAINHQIANKKMTGRDSIRQMFIEEFANADMTCIPENIFEDGSWAILEWKDPMGLRGCGFFRIAEDKIQFQRGYWDKLSFLRKHGLPIPTD